MSSHAKAAAGTARQTALSSVAGLEQRRERAAEHSEAGGDAALVDAEQLGAHEVAGGYGELDAPRGQTEEGRVHAELGDAFA